MLKKRGVEAGHRPLWDFDPTPENQRATADAGPPALVPKQGKKKAGRSASAKAAAVAMADDEEDGGLEGAQAAEEDVNEGAPVYELTWWVFGKGPQWPHHMGRRRASSRMILDEEEVLTQQDDSSSDDSSDEELSSDDEPGVLIGGHA